MPVTPPSLLERRDYLYTVISYILSTLSRRRGLILLENQWLELSFQYIFSWYINVLKTSCGRGQGKASYNRMANNEKRVQDSDTAPGSKCYSVISIIMSHWYFKQINLISSLCLLMFLNTKSSFL